MGTKWNPRMPQPAETRSVEICPVESAEALAQVRALFEEYWNSFGFTPCFQNFSSELAGLPGAYAPPDGRLAIAFVAGIPAGCVALRRFDENRAEPKRLYVRPQFRGLGIGRALLDWVIAEARAAGYAELVGDSMPVMREALAMYERTGFELSRTGGANAKIDLMLKL
jgi:putative acetyltransferase